MKRTESKLTQAPESRKMPKGSSPASDAMSPEMVARLQEVNDRIAISGVTQSAIASRLKVPTSTLCKVLSGQMKGRYGNARKAAVALGIIPGRLDVTVDDLLPGLSKAA